jgi:16S rRNA (guanine527-N7)-methyltransferase
MIGDEGDAREYCSQAVGSSGIDRLEHLARLLREENERQNLVSAGSLLQLWRRHFADSIQLLEHVPRGTEPVLDLGSGAGFPGLVVAAVRPEAQVILVESRKKRAEWLNFAAEQLQLPSCQVIAARVEALQPLGAGAITARAFAPLGKLLRLSARFSTPATVWLLPKGRSAAQELLEQPPSVREMFHVEPSLTDPDGGILVGRGVPAIT